MIRRVSCLTNGLRQYELLRNRVGLVWTRQSALYLSCECLIRAPSTALEAGYRAYTTKRSTENDNFLHREIQWIDKVVHATNGGLSIRQKERLSHVLQATLHSNDSKLQHKVANTFLKAYSRDIDEQSGVHSDVVDSANTLPPLDCDAMVKLLVKTNDIQSLRQLLSMSKRHAVDIQPMHLMQAMACFAKVDWLSDSLQCLRELLRICKRYHDSIADTSSVTGEANTLADAEFGVDTPHMELEELVPASLAMPALDALVTCSVRLQDLDATCMILTAMVRLKLPPNSHTVNGVILTASRKAKEEWDSAFSKLRFSRNIASQKGSGGTPGSLTVKHGNNIQTPLEAAWSWFWWLHEFLQLPIELRNINLLLREASTEDPFPARMCCSDISNTDRFSFTPEKLSRRTFAVYHHLRRLLNHYADATGDNNTEEIVAEPKVSSADETTLYYLLRASSRAGDAQALASALSLAERHNIVLSPRTCTTVITLLSTAKAPQQLLAAFLDYTCELPSKESDNSENLQWSRKNVSMFVDGLYRVCKKTLNSTLNVWLTEALYSLCSSYDSRHTQALMLQSAEMSVMSVCSSCLQHGRLNTENKESLENLMSMLSGEPVLKRRHFDIFQGCNPVNDISVSSFSPRLSREDHLSIQATSYACIVATLEKLQGVSSVDVEELKTRAEANLAAMISQQQNAAFNLIPAQRNRMIVYHRFCRGHDIDIITRLVPPAFSDILENLQNGPTVCISADSFGLLGPNNEHELRMPRKYAAVLQNLEQRSVEYVLQLICRSTSDADSIRSLILMFLELSKHSTLRSQKYENLSAAGYAANLSKANPPPRTISPTTWLRVAQAAERSGQHESALWLLQCGIASNSFVKTLPPVDDDMAMGRLLVPCSVGLSKREAQRRKQLRSANTEINRKNPATHRGIPESVWKGRLMRQYYGMLANDSSDNSLTRSLRGLVYMGGASGCFDMTHPGDQVLVLDVSRLITQEIEDEDTFLSSNSYLSGKWMGHVLQAYLPMLRLRLQKIWDSSGIAPPGVLIHGKAHCLDEITEALLDCWPMKSPLFHTQLHTQPWLYATSGQVYEWIEQNRDSNSEEFPPAHRQELVGVILGAKREMLSKYETFKDWEDARQ